MAAPSPPAVGGAGAGGPAPGDGAALERFCHALETCHHVEDVVDELVDLVLALGGEVVPVRDVDAHLIPIDLALGTREPVLAQAEAASTARLALDRALPLAVAAARALATRLLTDELVHERPTAPVPWP